MCIMTKFASTEPKKKCFVHTISYWKYKDQSTESVDTDDAAHVEPPQLDVCFCKFDYFHLSVNDSACDWLCIDSTNINCIQT